MILKKRDIPLIKKHIKPLKTHTFFFLFFLFLGLQSAVAQGIKGTVIDAETKDPIPWARIIGAHDDCATFTDERGEFELACTQLIQLKIEAFGYVTKIIENPKDNGVFELSMSPELLLPIELVESNVVRKGKIGNIKARYLDRIQVSSSKSAMELGLKVTPISGGCTLQTLHMLIAENDYDSLALRFNFYRIIDGKPSEELICDPVDIVLARGKRHLKIDMIPNQIKVEEEFLVSVLFFHDLSGNKNGLWFGARYKENDVKGVYRHLGISGWETGLMDVGIWFDVIY